MKQFVIRTFDLDFATRLGRVVSHVSLDVFGAYEVQKLYTHWQSLESCVLGLRPTGLK